jgi:hypothetical protein
VGSGPCRRSIRLRRDAVDRHRNHRKGQRASRHAENNADHQFRSYNTGLLIVAAKIGSVAQVSLLMNAAYVRQLAHPLTPFPRRRNSFIDTMKPCFTTPAENDDVIKLAAWISGVGD